jgi:hypothetical protein
MANDHRQSMTAYRRFENPEATRFFTVNLVERHGNRLLTDHPKFVSCPCHIVLKQH